MIDRDKIKDGVAVTCRLLGNTIKDAKLSVNSSGRVYICQNVTPGSVCTDKHGYKYSYFIGSIETVAEGKHLNLKIIHKDWDDEEN